MTSHRTYVIDAIPGDGIGPEVVEPTIACVDRVASLHGFSIDWRARDWGSDRYRRTGAMMPVDGLDALADGDGILLGAVGDPDIDDVTTLWGLLIPIRRTFDQYVNVRPTTVLPGVQPAVADAVGMDLVIVRENVEGEYSEAGGRLHRGTEHELVIQEAVFTRRNTARVARYAASLADRRGAALVSATKSNGIIHSMPFWDEVVRDVVREEHPGLVLESVLIDALAARLVLKPRSASVIVASNLFGDILSDLAAAVAGSIGIAPSANLDPERRHPSLFEPVHGTAPDIVGRDLANPIGCLWAASLMLEHLGEHAAAASLHGAFSDVLAAGTRTRDLGGDASTTTFSRAVLDAIDVQSAAPALS
ncbi:isocitrate/isopropylmalate family dehydrogenase [Agrococcus jejuensis]|uniref:Tartrate dehydrogenase/decarboxylase / D-malate dehydrogenase n=1 Tax=Agrococcus jejuensis TaxID=399736 RepID=A0A1G8DZ45_9MICO|nr:isocitrate/isopropylmalate family dehydrogenase [Agrococcus jejuensis]SDH63036.1 tartrate dehydrogenase/decarboxylase / D-malate dehydrogenase [Agrococcus jejuensis]